MSANMKMGNATMFQNHSFVQSSYPAVCFKNKVIKLLLTKGICFHMQAYTFCLFCL